MATKTLNVQVDTENKCVNRETLLSFVQMTRVTVAARRCR